MEYLYFNLAQLKTRSSDVKCEFSSYIVTGNEHKSYLSVHVFYIAQMFDSMCDSVITGHGQFSKKKFHRTSVSDLPPIFICIPCAKPSCLVCYNRTWAVKFEYCIFKYFNIKAGWNYIYLLFINTVQCHHNAINFLQYPRNKHPIVHPWVLDTCMGYLMRVQSSICVMLLWLHCWIYKAWYNVIMAHVCCYMPM